MNPTEIEFAVRDLVAKPYDPECFPFELLRIYNVSPVTIHRLKSGLTNKADQPGDLLWKGKLFFRPATQGEDVAAIGDALAGISFLAKFKPRFILVTNGEQVHVRDVQLDDTLNIEYARLDENSDFLLPIAGHERRAIVEEHPADIKAAKKLKKLYDAVLAANPTWSSGHHAHELNLLMTRLLFCFYAEDTGIFETPQVFTHTLTQYTREDGGDIANLLDRLFRTMNIEKGERPKTTPAVEGRFPYVNGSLFEDTVEIPQFNRTARRQMLECGDLDWTTINPDIFGSMIQTIAQDGTRSDFGMHYTSRPNIMKVLRPLLLDDLNEAFDKAKESLPRLKAVLGRLSRIRIFDPACGSGNFLIMAYKELRALEMDVLQRIRKISTDEPLPLSVISLENFVGIDIVDFACEIAKLSLWIAEYQANAAFKELFGSAKSPLPLGKINTVHRADALLVDWLTICPKNEDSETYVCGNPPYAGYQTQTPSQKAELAVAIGKYVKAFKRMDYISGWLILGAHYIKATGAKIALVSTNSICQGEQVAMLWKPLFNAGIVISFAYAPFKWSNSATNNAGVTCVIVGLADKPSQAAMLIDNGNARRVKTIGPYLVPDDSQTIVNPQTSPQNGLPTMLVGNRPADGGHLILSPSQKIQLLAQYPQAAVFVKRYVGADDFLNHIERFCLWIDEGSLESAESIPAIQARLDETRRFRANSGIQARLVANVPYRFDYITYRNEAALIMPMVTSEKRKYLQVGLLGANDIASNKLYVVYDPPGYLFALLSSRLHRIWAETVGGRLEMRLQYSSSLVYNTFPVPALSKEQQHILADHSSVILKTRALHPSKTIAWLYNPETMPGDLLEGHRTNDAYIEEYVYGRRFRDDTHRLEHLFAMYAAVKEKMNELPLAAVSKSGNTTTVEKARI
ncbi:MAG TPA: DNA methyltransferase [Verrucomicrobiae bacterium]|nr:DNA methyltransferase [Verrucomicrobiae bacterium]